MASRTTRFDATRLVRALTLESKLPGLDVLEREQQALQRLDKKAGFKWYRESLVETLRTAREAEELHQLLFEKVPHPRFICDGRTLRILAVNEAAVRIYGYPREEFLRMKVTDLGAPEILSGFKTYCRRLPLPHFGVAPPANNVFRHRKKDGRLIDVAVDAALIQERGQRMFLLVAEDVTEKRRAEQRLRAHQATTRALAESSTLAEASPKIFRAICENLGCDWGELWRVDPTGQLLRCTEVWHPDGGSWAEMERASRNMVYMRGEGIPGRVWAHNKPVWIADVTQHPELRRAPAVDKSGLRSAFAFPIRLNREVLGVITIFTRQVLPPDKHLLHLLKDICSQIGQVMGRRRAERQLLEVSEREQQRIGQDLHDGLCQQLAGISYIASTLQSRLEKKSPRDAAVAGRIAELSRQTASQARQIARGLNPVKVGTVGLVSAFEELVSSIRSMFSIACRFECKHRIFIRDHEAAVHLYRIAQEAIHNAITHGKATEIVVSLNRQSRLVTLSIKDNGRGLSKPSGDGSGMGFENMNYRARAIGARLHFAARPGGGTVMNCTFST